VEIARRPRSSRSLPVPAGVPPLRQDRDRPARGREATLHFVFPNFLGDEDLRRSRTQVFVNRYRKISGVCCFQNFCQAAIFLEREENYGETARKCRTAFILYGFCGVPADVVLICFKLAENIAAPCGYETGTPHPREPDSCSPYSTSAVEGGFVP